MTMMGHQTAKMVVAHGWDHIVRGHLTELTRLEIAPGGSKRWERMSLMKGQGYEISWLGVDEGVLRRYA